MRRRARGYYAPESAYGSAWGYGSWGGSWGGWGGGSYGHYQPRYARTPRYGYDGYAYGGGWDLGYGWGWGSGYWFVSRYSTQGAWCLRGRVLDCSQPSYEMCALTSYTDGAYCFPNTHYRHGVRSVAYRTHARPHALAARAPRTVLVAKETYRTVSGSGGGAKTADDSARLADALARVKADDAAPLAFAMAPTAAGAALAKPEETTEPEGGAGSCRDRACAGRAQGAGPG